MNEKDKAINDLVGELEIDAKIFTHDFMPKNPMLDYDTAVHIWLFRKLSELQLEINELKNK